MVFFADIRCTPFRIEVNANYVRTVIEDALDIEVEEDVLYAVCLRVEVEVRYELTKGFDMGSVGEIILDCYHSETSMV